MAKKPYTWLGSEVPWLGLNGRLWGHRRLPPWGPPAASLPSNLRKLGQELLLHILGMNPGLLLLPREVGGRRGQSSLLPFQTLLPPCEEGSPSPCPPASPGAAGSWLLHGHGLHTGLIDLVDDYISQLTHKLPGTEAADSQEG